MTPITILGLWHQGIVAAAVFADLGFDVLAADPDAKTIASLCAGKAPIFEPGLDDLLQKGLASGRLRFTSDLAGAVRGRPNVWLMHDTPVDENDRPDTGVVFRAAEAVAPALAVDALVVVTAQVPVGTCDEIHKRLAAAAPHARARIAYIPENLRLGQAIERFRKPALPVMGSDDPAALDRLETLLAPLGVAWKRVGLRTAEMVKHALNAFLGVSICFANELGNLCDEVGANGFHVAEALRLEPRVGPKAMLLPGLGFSGGTLARDMQTLRGLGRRFGLETRLLDGAWEANARQNSLVVRKLSQALGPLRDQPVAVWGLTYKPGTSTLRRSAALAIVGDLVREGVRVTAHDPKADRVELAACSGFTFVEDPYAAVRNARGLVLLTAWPEYQTSDFERIRGLMANPLILDTANALDADRLIRLGFHYLDVGRGRRGGQR
jgi:UDPglucose 6-dehydrogenase